MFSSSSKHACARERPISNSASRANISIMDNVSGREMSILNWNVCGSGFAKMIYLFSSCTEDVVLFQECFGSSGAGGEVHEVELEGYVIISGIGVGARRVCAGAISFWGQHLERRLLRNVRVGGKYQFCVDSDNAKVSAWEDRL